MSKQWDVQELMWYGVNRVQEGDTVKNEDGLISKVVRKDNNVIWTEPAEMPVKKPDVNYVAHMVMGFITWICSVVCWSTGNLQLGTMIMTLAVYFLVMALHCKEDK